MVLEIIKEQNGERHGVKGRVAHQLGIGVETLRRWVSQAEIDGGLRPGLVVKQAINPYDIKTARPQCAFGVRPRGAAHC